MDESFLLTLCTAFIAGALASSFPAWQGETLVGIVGGLLIVVRPQRLPRWGWGLVTIVALFSCGYVGIRQPHPSPGDISTKAPLSGVSVIGTVATPPRLSRSGRAQFTLRVSEIKLPQEKKPQPLEGKLYITSAVTQVTGVQPGQRIQVNGNLYKPNPPVNPGQFDFRLYLQRQGIFAGLTARYLTPQAQSPPWGVWWIRNRMVRAHVMGAGMPEGALLSSLVVGSRAVDLPTEVKDIFTSVGLAHALSASGFHVAIVLGIVLALVQHISPRGQFIVGTLALLGYLMLTGVNPAVLRAVVMGIGALTGRLTDRKGRPVMGLALAAVILLLINPLWIWDLGFQFSFLATLGLIVTVNPIIRATLAQLPPALATAIAVPQAAFIWTLPLQLYAIGGFSAYCILANVLTSPLFICLIFGGLISGVLGVVVVPAGAVASWFTQPLATLTIGVATVVANLPGNFRNTGTIAPWQLFAAYGLIGWVWLHPWWHRPQLWRGKTFPRWLIAASLFTLLLFAPLEFRRRTVLQATVLEADQAPVMLIQSYGKTILINAGSRKQAPFTLLGLFQKAGISRIDWGIATHTQSDISGGWSALVESGVPIDRFLEAKGVVVSQAYQQLTRDLTTAGVSPVGLDIDKRFSLDHHVKVDLIQASPSVLKVKIDQTEWLLIGDLDVRQQRLLLRHREKLKAGILWWTGGELSSELLQSVDPQIAVASSRLLTPTLEAALENKGITVFATGRDGAILWTKDEGVQPLRDREDAQVAL